MLVLTAVLLVTACAWFPAQRLQFDQSIEALYSSDDPHIRDYLDSKSAFGGDEFAIAAYTDPELMEPAGLERLEDFSKQFEQLPGVVEGSVQNLAQALAAARLPFLARSKAQLLEMFRGILLGADNRTTAVVMRLAEEPPSPGGTHRAETIDRIRALADRHVPRAYVVGESIQVHDMFRYVERDGTVLGLASSLLLVLVILFLFRSLRWMLLPLAVVHVTLIWTQAILVLCGTPLSMVSSMLTSLVTVIGVATVIHVAVRFREQQERLGPADALRQTLLQLARPVFWTCTTTAGGFAVQWSSHIHPVQSFGLMMALGSMLVLLASALTLPGGVLLGFPHAAADALPPGITGASAEPTRARLADGPPTGISRALALLTRYVETYPGRLAVGFVVMIVLALGGFFRLRVETDFTKNFRSTSSIVESLNFVETRLGGAGTWEVNFPAPAELTAEFLERVRRLATRLRTLESPADDSLTKVIAATDGIDLIPRIPFLIRDLDGQIRALELFQPEFLRSLYNAEAGRMRIMLRARERQPSGNKLRLIETVRDLADQEFPGARATGLFVLLAFLIESLLGDQWISFSLASIVITSMMSIAFGSLRLGLISLVPNVLPIVIVIGTMGWVGLPINIATAMIASVSMGLTIDSSIHFLSAFERARQQGAGFYEALRETHQGVGLALVYANITLIVGFLVLVLSNFVPLIYFGILVSVAMLGGLIGNMVLLPLLLRLFPAGDRA